MMDEIDYSLEALLKQDQFSDGCGKIHRAGVKEVLIGSGVIESLPSLLEKYHIKKPFLLADVNTWTAAGEQVGTILSSHNIPFSRYIFSERHLEPDEQAVGSAVMHYDSSCDGVIGIGSGVLNDIGKLLAMLTGNTYFIVATAPSMDGFASATSSMSRAGLKVSLPSKYASVVIGDTTILAAAPSDMLAAGVGDMVAKYISLCEWRLAHLIVGEYYCPAIDRMVRTALDATVLNAAGLARREPKAVESVMRGLVLAGIAMNYAGLSRPASGIEHYYSHIWDMRALEFGTPCTLHGLQCGVATLLSLDLYEKISQLTPDRDRARDHARSFDKDAWFAKLRQFLGKGADAMIAAEQTDGKYAVDTHAARFETIYSNWDQILEIIHTLPSRSDVEATLRTVGAPTSPEELSQPEDVIRMCLPATKDIRDKYVASRLLWDLGIDSL